MFKSLTTEWSWPVFLGCRRPVSCAAFCASLQTFCGAGCLLPSTLPRQTLHEATGHSRDDDDAHKQGRGHPDNQGDEEQVSNWRGNPERQVEGFRGRMSGELCFDQLILQLSNIQEQLPEVWKSRSVLPPACCFISKQQLLKTMELCNSQCCFQATANFVNSILSLWWRQQYDYVNMLIRRQAFTPNITKAEYFYWIIA